MFLPGRTYCRTGKSLKIEKFNPLPMYSYQTGKTKLCRITLGWIGSQVKSWILSPFIKSVKKYLSGVYGPSTVAHIQGAWQIYQHSGNKTFLEQSYQFYKELFWDGIGSKHWLYAYDSG